MDRTFINIYKKTIQKCPLTNTSTILQLHRRRVNFYVFIFNINIYYYGYSDWIVLCADVFCNTLDFVLTVAFCNKVVAFCKNYCIL